MISYLLFGLVFALGAAYRIALLWEPARCDEIYSILHYAANPLSQIVADYSFPNNHVMYTLLMHMSYLGFGLSKLGMRAPAFLAGLICLPLSAWLAWILTEDRRVALLTLVFSAVSWPLVYFSVNGRGYTLQTMSALGLSIAIHHPRLRLLPRLGLIVILLVMLLYTIPSGVVVAVPVLVWAGIMGFYRRSPAWFMAIAACSTATMCCLVILYGPLLKVLAGSAKPAYISPLSTFTETAQFLCDGILPPALFFALVAMGLWALVQRHQVGKALYLGLLIFFYPAMTWFGKWLPFPLMFTRSYTPLFPAAYLLAAVGFWSALDLPRRRQKIWLQMTALVVLGVNVTYGVLSIFKDRSRLYFPERPIMAAGEKLIPPQARALDRGETLAGVGFYYDSAAAYYVIQERGFKGFYSAFALDARKIHTLYLVAASDAEALQSWHTMNPANWSKPQRRTSSGPMTLYVIHAL